MPGIVLLNETDVSEIFDDPDTLIINGEDILIGPNGEVVLSTGLEGDQVVVDGLSGLSDQIQKAVEEAIREGLTGTTETEVVVVNLLGSGVGTRMKRKQQKSSCDSLWKKQWIESLYRRLCRSCWTSLLCGIEYSFIMPAGWKTWSRVVGSKPR